MLSANKVWQLIYNVYFCRDEAKNNIMTTKAEVLKAIETIEKYKEEQKQVLRELDIELDTRHVSILGLNTRELNALIYYEIETIGELLALDRFNLRRARGMGKKSIENINKKIKEFGINTPEFRT